MHFFRIEETAQKFKVHSMYMICVNRIARVQQLNDIDFHLPVAES